MVPRARGAQRSAARCGALPSARSPLPAAVPLRARRDGAEAEVEAGTRTEIGDASRGAAGPCSAAAAASLPPRAPLPSAAAAGLFSDLYGPGRVPLSSGARSPIAAEPLGTAEFTLQSRRRAQPRAHAARRGPAERRGTAPARPRRRGGERRGAASGGRWASLRRPLRSPPGPAAPRSPPARRGVALEAVGAKGCARGACPATAACHTSSRTRGRVYMSWPRAPPTDRARGAQGGCCRSLQVDSCSSYLQEAESERCRVAPFPSPHSTCRPPACLRG